MRKPALIVCLVPALLVGLACLCPGSQAATSVAKGSDTPETGATPIQGALPLPEATATLPPRPAATLAPQPTVASSHPGGQIVFVSCKSQNPLAGGTQCGLFLMDADGSGLRQLTNVDGDSEPSLSPDGTRVAFDSSKRDGDYEIYLIHTDGSGLVRLTTHPGNDLHPGWSPDGNQISYISCSGLSNCSISVVGADGSNPHPLFKTDANFFDWSPDGRQIVFAAAKTLNIINADGTNVRLITTQTQFVYSPVWSPDGGKIAFLVQKTKDGPVELDVIDEGGTNQRSLTAGYYVIYGGLSWSPDGQMLLFTMNGDGRSTKGASQVYIVNADGSGLHKLDVPCTYCYAGDWR